MYLGWDEVRQVLAAIDASPGEELELEVGELRVVVRKGRHGSGRAAPSARAFELTSPAVGIFRRAAVADGLAFVGAGALTEPGEVLAAIEVLSEIEPVRAPGPVEVVSVLVPDGEFVEYGQPLMLLRPR
jgi:biotin carboxyl carrier protein